MDEGIVDGIKPIYKVEFLEEYRKHIYVIDGTKYASVTNVLGIIGGQKMNMLMNWSKKLAVTHISDSIKQNVKEGLKIDDAFIDKVTLEGSRKPDSIKNTAGAFGTKAHDLMDNWIKTKEVPTEDNPAKPVFDGFMKYLEENKPNIVSGDIILGSRKDMIGGRADLIIKNEEGEYCVVDFKTSKFTSPDFHLQVSAYAKMFSEQYNVPLAKKAYLIKFAKDEPEYEVIEVNNIERNYKAFLAAKVLKDAVDAIGKGN